MASQPLMPFLRPSPLPRLSSLRQLTQPISSRNPQHHQRAAITTPAFSQTSSPPSTPPPQPPAASTPSPSPAPELQQLPYHVHRTASQELPIYHLAKRGGNLHQTRIRKIEGDVDKLRDELQAMLGLETERVKINRLTGHIVVKGWFRDKIRRFLEEKRF